MEPIDKTKKLKKLHICKSPVVIPNTAVTSIFDLQRLCQSKACKRKTHVNEMFTSSKAALSVKQSLLDSYCVLRASVIRRQISSSSTKHQNENIEVDGEASEEQSQGRRRPTIPYVDVETSMRYMKSNAYRKTYGNKRVWEMYKRNFKGNIMPPTRLTCIVGNKITSGNPCPVCRDHYLVVDYRNTDLIEQFLEPNTTQVIDSMKTGVCQRQHRRLKDEVSKAIDFGVLEGYVPFREYDQKYYKNLASFIKNQEEKVEKDNE